MPRKESRAVYSKDEIKEILQRKHPDSEIIGMVMDKGAISVEFKNEN